MQGRPSRKLWIAAIVVSVVCVAGLAYALITDWHTEPDRRSQPAERAHAGGAGFGLGVIVGIGAGVVLGSLIALHRRGR